MIMMMMIIMMIMTMTTTSMYRYIMIPRERTRNAKIFLQVGPRQTRLGSVSIRHKSSSRHNIILSPASYFVGVFQRSVEFSARRRVLTINAHRNTRIIPFSRICYNIICRYTIILSHTHECTHHIIIYNIVVTTVRVIVIICLMDIFRDERTAAEVIIHLYAIRAITRNVLYSIGMEKITKKPSNNNIMLK